MVMAFPPPLFAEPLEPTGAWPLPNPAEPAANPSLDTCCPFLVRGYCPPRTSQLGCFWEQFSTQCIQSAGFQAFSQNQNDVG